MARHMRVMAEKVAAKRGQTIAAGDVSATAAIDEKRAGSGRHSVISASKIIVRPIPVITHPPFRQMTRGCQPFAAISYILVT